MSESRIPVRRGETVRRILAKGRARQETLPVLKPEENPTPYFRKINDHDLEGRGGGDHDFED